MISVGILAQIDMASDRSSSMLMSSDGFMEASAATSETAVRMTFRNATDQMVTAFWVDFDGVRQRYADIAAGGSWQARTYDGHVWAFVTEHGLCIDQHEVVSGERRYTIR